MGKILVIAHETLCGQALKSVVRDRANAGHRVKFVVPLRIPMYADLGALGGYGFVAMEAADADAIEREATARLDATIAELADEGIQVTGHVVCLDPLAAVDRALERYAADEVIISTKPRAISRWLGMDLPKRISRRHPAITVTTVENRARVLA